MRFNYLPTNDRIRQWMANICLSLSITWPTTRYSIIAISVTVLKEFKTGKLYTHCLQLVLEYQGLVYQPLVACLKR